MDPFAANQTPVADDAAIVNHYPMPLARGWQRVLVAAARPSLHHEALLVMAETLAAVLGGIAVAAYQGRAAQPDPALNRSLRTLRHVTLGQWLGWVRAALAAVPAAEAPIPGLAATYEALEDNLLLFGYEGLRGQMVVYLGGAGDYGPREAASTRLLLELINQYQLRLAKHPPAPDSGWDPMGIVTVLAPGLRAALSRLARLADYPLLGLVRDTGGQVQVLRLMGFTAEESSVELDPEAAPPGTLLLADPDEMPMLVLDPWLIFARCPECGNTQVAALAGQRDGGTDYFGLDCGHVWPVTGPPAPITLDLTEAAAAWTPDESELVETPTALHLAMAAQFEREQQAMAAERAGRQTPAPGFVPRVVTAEELETQTRALQAQIRREGERRIVPEQATLPEEEERLLAEYQRLEQMQAEAERRFEERTRGNA
jgi:hypothetical protein